MPTAQPAAMAAGPAWRRHAPEQSLLYRTILENLETFLAQSEVPAFVARTFRRFLECGILAKGFLRVVCLDCKTESLVAFSCKDRGICPSCMARRAASTAAHLVDAILPHVPYRQWVLAMPFDLHHRLTRDAELEGRVLAVFIEELERGLYGTVLQPEQQVQPPEGAPAAQEGRPRAGFFTATQHFGSSLNLHVHFHVLATDGLYERQPDGALTFLRARAPTSDELTALVQRVAARVQRLVGRPSEAAEPMAQAPVLKLFGAPPQESDAPSLAVEHDGFNLHANVAFEANARAAIERLCRYMLRGPLASGRLRQGPRGKLFYELKTPRADGTSHIVLSPLALLQRLSWLCVLPRAHTTHYHGVLAPSHPWRPLVVPAQHAHEELVPLRRCASRWIDWADLLRRVFAVQVLVCSTCGGPRRILQVVKEGPVARKILGHLGLPTEPPRRTPARVPEQLEAWDTGPPATPDTEAPECDEQPPPFFFDQRHPESIEGPEFHSLT